MTAVPRTMTGKELYRLAEAVAVKLEPDGGGPFVDVAVLAVQMVRESICDIEDEAAASSPALDVRRVVQAITNVAKRHGIVKDPPVDTSLARIYGFSTTLDNMDAMIAAEYALLATGSEATPEDPT